MNESIKPGVPFVLHVHHESPATPSWIKYAYLTLIRSIELLDGSQHVLGCLATSHGSSVVDFEDKSGAAVMWVAAVNCTTCFVRAKEIRIARTVVVSLLDLVHTTMNIDIS